MVQDDSYYINLGYEYARRRKELDLLNEEKQDLLAEAIKVNRLIEEADKVLDQHKKLVYARRRLHYMMRHEHDHDNDKPAEGKMIVTLSESIPSWVDEDESYDNE
jgi:hypothetical protein